MALKVAHQKLKDLLQLLSNDTRDGLVTLPGIREVTADLLLAKRSEVADQGRAFRLTDLIEVKGIGPAKLARMAGEEITKDVLKFTTYYIKHFGSKCPGSIISVDLGTVNSAYALLDNSLRLHAWTKVNLEMPKPYSPGNCFENVQRALKEFPSADMFIVEAQSHRNPAMLGFLGISIQLRILEAFVHAVARTTLSSPVQSVEAKTVAQYFGIRAGKSREKKKASVELVSRLLLEEGHQTPMGNKVFISDNLKDCFWKEKKKDDLSDCLLQAIAVLEWGQMARDL